MQTRQLGRSTIAVSALGLGTNYVGGHNLYTNVDASSLDVVDGLKGIAAAKGAPVAHVALQWLLSRPAVGSVICGAKQSEQVKQNIACDALSLTAQELASVDALVA